MGSLSNCPGYSQIITVATHFQPNCSPSCIDLIFADQPNLVSHSGVHVSLYNTCHHQISFAKIDLKIHLPPSYKREIWTYSKAEEELIKQAVSNFNWVDALSNINTNKQVDRLTSTLLNIFRNFIPHKTIACKYNDAPWITSKIKTMLRKKNRLYRKYIANGLRDDYKLALDELSIICSDQISSSKEINFKNLGKKLNDPALGPKAFWSILNGFFRKKKKFQLFLLF